MKKKWGAIFIVALGLLIWELFFHQPNVRVAPPSPIREDFHNVASALRADTSKLPTSLFETIPEFEFAWYYRQRSSVGSPEVQQTIYRICDILISTRMEFASEKAYLHRTAPQ